MFIEIPFHLISTKQPLNEKGILQNHSGLLGTFLQLQWLSRDHWSIALEWKRTHLRKLDLSYIFKSFF